MTIDAPTICVIKYTTRKLFNAVGEGPLLSMVTVGRKLDEKKIESLK